MRKLKLSGCDCESPEDFGQYYRNRYFGLQGEDSTIHPSSLVQVKGGTCAIYRYKRPGAEPEAETYQWADLRKRGLFGKPSTGNIVYGSGYVYTWDFARRESQKGFNPSGVLTWHPDMYGLKSFEEKIRGRSGQAARFDSVWNVYNPTFWNWGDAIRQLESGERIGCPITEKLGLFLKLKEPNVHVSYKYNHIGELTPSDGNIELLPKFKYMRQILENIIPTTVRVS